MLIDKSNRSSLRDSVSAEDDFHIRSYVAADQPDVWHLYQKGMLAGHVDPKDDVSDLTDIENNYFKRSQDHFWVAEAKNSVIGTVALAEDDAGVARLWRLRVSPFWQLDNRVVSALVRTAIEHARSHGCLKVVFQSSLDGARAIALLEGMGLQFARIRDAGGRHMIEFYDNLYATPDDGSFANP